MINKVIIILLIVMCSNSCAQVSKQESCSKIEYVPMDFTKHNGDLAFSAEKNGIITFRCYYGYSSESQNPYGKAQVYMIHKNGGEWWYKEAKSRFPTFEGRENPYPNLDAVENLYNDRDSTSLKDYYKWAFFIDKKFLTPVVSGGGEKDVVYTSYQPTYPHTVILFEQKAGSDEWLEIDCRMFKSELEKEKCEWECGFYRGKMQELNKEYNR